MTGIPPVTTAGLDDPNRRRRHREVTDLMLNFQHDDSRIRTPQETAASVTPLNFAYPPGHILRYGKNTTPGTTDMSRAFADMSATGHDQIVPPDVYSVSGGVWSMTVTGQRLTGGGRGCTFVRKRSNGALLTIAASYVTIEDIDISNDLSSTYTGVNIAGTGTRTGVILNRVNSFRSLTNCLNFASFGHWRINDCYMDNTPASAGTPVVVVGTSGLGTYASLYGGIHGGQYQPSGNPIQFDSCGGCLIIGAQIGGWDNNVATGASTVNTLIGCRIVGNVSIEGSGHNLLGNALGGYALTFETVSGQNMWIGTRDTSLSSIVNNGAASNIVIESDVASGILTILDQFQMRNNKYIRAMNAAGTNYGQFGMSTGDNFQFSNLAGNTQISAAGTAKTVQLIVNGAVAVQTDDSATAGNTRLLVYDVDNATLERVTVGAADSGGAGFKLLRIPN